MREIPRWTSVPYRGFLAEIYRTREGRLELAPPATAFQIHAIERDLDSSVEPGLRAAWLEANGGPAWMPVFTRPGYESGYVFLSVEEAAGRRQPMKQNAPRYMDYIDPRPQDPRIQAGWFNDD
ncbi:hypothetical protein [Streptomyces sp. NPDC088246]|uniref:hypothetical protein n=1 Tax=Streptomyces sp. NPDC088246 TaxID=3365842 RepID=UPI0038167D8B